MPRTKRVCVFLPLLFLFLVGGCGGFGAEPGKVSVSSTKDFGKLTDVQSPPPGGTKAKTK